MLLFVYTTTRKRFVIFTCRYFRLSWNTTALSQSNCRNLSCSGIRPGKQILGKQIRPNFFAFDKFALQNLANKSGGVWTNLLYFLYITSGVKQYYEARFLSYRPRTALFHNFEIQIALIQYSGRSKHATGLLAKPLKKNPKITYTASRLRAVECLNEH